MGPTRSSVFGKVCCWSGVWVMLSQIYYCLVEIHWAHLKWLHLNVSFSPTPSVLSESLPSPSFLKLSSPLPLAQWLSHHHRVANPSLIPPTQPNHSLLIPNDHLKAIINPKSKLPDPKFTKFIPNPYGLIHLLNHRIYLASLAMP